MDRNEKFLKRLNAKEFKAVYGALLKIQEGKTKSLNIVKLSGHQDIYRVRVGQVRIIFIANRAHIEILDIARRSEKTYRDY